MKPKTILSLGLAILFIMGLNIGNTYGQSGLQDDIPLMECTPEIDPGWLDPSTRSTKNQPSLRTTQPPWSPTGHPTVRVAYLIPSNRSPQPMGVAGLQYIMTVARDFFKEQMTHNGLDPKTINYETESDGVTPLIHMIDIPETDDMIRQSIWTNTINAALSQAVPVWENNEVWLLVPEAHLLLPDGFIEGWTALGASSGSANDPGVAILGSTTLTLLAQGMITDDRRYNGMIIPEIGPYALQESISFPSFEGSTLSSICSSHLGAFIHELSHALGLSGHDMRNDSNFHGNLMGHGLRGMRGYLFPNKYPTDYTRVAFGNAHTLNTSHYFNSNLVRNQVDHSSSGTSSGRNIIKGLLVLDDIEASDTDGLSLVRLISGMDGNVAEKRLHGATSFNGTLATPYFKPGSNTDFWLQYYDMQGNKAEYHFQYTPPSVNGAPKPFVRINPPIGADNDLFTLDASSSMDQDGDNPLTYAWDHMNNGDYKPGTAIMERHFEPGNHQVSVKVTDNQGNYAVSSPIGLHVSGDAPPPPLPEDIEWIHQSDAFIEGVATYGDGVYVVATFDEEFEGSDAFIRKYNTNGAMEWTREFGSPGGTYDFARGVAADASGIYVVGELEGENAGDAFIGKYDVNGNELWSHRSGAFDYDAATGVTTDASGVYVAGITYDVLPGQTSSGDPPNPDAFVRKYDANGNEVWTRQFGTSAHDEAVSISVYGSGVYVTGNTHGELSSPPNPNQFSDVFVRKYDINGNEEWTRQFGLGWLSFNASAISANGSGVYISGWGEPTDKDGNTGLWRRYDSDGNVVSGFQFEEGSKAQGISVTTSGVYVTWTTDVEPKGSSVGRFNVNGSQEWAIDNFDRISAISTSASAIYVGGAIIAKIIDDQLPPADQITFTLFDATSDQVVPGYDPIPDNARLVLSNLPEYMNIRANIPNSSESVRFDYDGEVGFKVENNAPYALFGNRGSDYYPGTFDVGMHTLTATSFPRNNARGEPILTQAIKFTVVEREDLIFTLVDAKRDRDIRVLKDGDVISGVDLEPLNIRVDVVPRATSVRFDFDGEMGFKVENNPPYALFGNSGDDYTAGRIEEGMHTLTATAFSRNHASGMEVASRTINFEAVLTTALEKQVMVYNYPNPFYKSTNITYELPQAKNIHLGVYDLWGREVAVLANEWKEAGRHEVIHAADDLPEGFYIYKLITPQGTVAGRMLQLK